jgi:hypothetical protein
MENDEQVYKIICVNDFGIAEDIELEKKLNDLAKDGWRVYAIDHKNNYILAKMPGTK